MLVFARSRPTGKSWLPMGIVAFLGLYFILPDKWRSTNDLDSRLLPGLFTCLLAFLGSMRIPPDVFSARGRFGPRISMGLALLTACLVLRDASIFGAWQHLDNRLRAEAGAFDLLPVRCKLLPVALIPKMTKEHPEIHFAAWAAAYKEAFVPTLFTMPDQQPLTLNLPARRVEAQTLEIDDNLAQQYDYLWVFNPEGRELSVPPRFERVFAAEYVTMWRIPKE
jgi:hypothetical protein